MSAILLLFSLALFSEPSRYTSVEVDIQWNGSEKETLISCRAIAGDDGRFLRITRDYDPDYMEVEVLQGLYGFHGSLREVPDWAVDTLTGSEGWPRALVVAFPGLRPGMELRWTWRVTDNGAFSRQGLFYTYIAGNEPDTIVVRCEDLEELSSWFTGFRETSRGNTRIFTSLNEEYKELWLSTASDWTAVESILLGSSREASQETPPDLREASIEAGAAGALPRMRISRGRVLITESMQLLPFPGGDAGFAVRPIQEILDTRRATPMEAATLLSSMCRVMGIEAPVVTATDILPPIPSPLGFFRAFILAEGILEEPSEYLSPAGWIDTRDTLWLLLPGGLLAELPPEMESEHCTETWSFRPSQGRFSVQVAAEGGFDRELRRRLAGLEGEELLLRTSEWFRASGIYFYPDSVGISDFYDLTEQASMTVTGSMSSSDGFWVERAPSLLWNRSGSVDRIYPTARLLNGLLVQ